MKNYTSIKKDIVEDLRKIPSSVYLLMLFATSLTYIVSLLKNSLLSTLAIVLLMIFEYFLIAQIAYLINYREEVGVKSIFRGIKIMLITKDKIFLSILLSEISMLFFLFSKTFLFALGAVLASGALSAIMPSFLLLSSILIPIATSIFFIINCVRYYLTTPIVASKDSLEGYKISFSGTRAMQKSDDLISTFGYLELVILIVKSAFRTLLSNIVVILAIAITSTVFIKGSGVTSITFLARTIVSYAILTTTLLLNRELNPHVRDNLGYSQINEEDIVPDVVDKSLLI